MLLFVFFFGFSFTSLSSFFTHIETNQSVGGAKTGIPGEKPPDTPASRTRLVSYMNSCPVQTLFNMFKSNMAGNIRMSNENGNSNLCSPFESCPETSRS